MDIQNLVIAYSVVAGLALVIGLIAILLQRR
jgi:hypothetical protein